MKLKIAATLVTVTSVVGCQTVPNEQYVFVRVDGQRASDNPAYATKFELDKSICFGEVQQTAAGAPLIYYQGLAGAISAAAVQSQQQQVYLDIMKGCMAGRGYMMVVESQAPATHARFKANPQPMPDV